MLADLLLFRFRFGKLLTGLFHSNLEVCFTSFTIVYLSGEDVIANAADEGVTTSGVRTERFGAVKIPF